MFRYDLLAVWSMSYQGRPWNEFKHLRCFLEVRIDKHPHNHYGSEVTCHPS